MNEEVKYRHTPDMGEISGFGGGYEECCQDMLEAGVKWLNEQPTKPELVVLTANNVIGVLFAESDDAKAMERVIIAAAKGEATGAMHQTVMLRLGYINKNGWDAYCEEIRKLEAEDEEPK